MDANQMLDVKAVAGAVIVMGAAVQSWIQTANDYATLAVTVIGGLVGIATIWYTVERARRLRRERKDNEEE